MSFDMRKCLSEHILLLSGRLIEKTIDNGESIFFKASAHVFRLAAESIKKMLAHLFWIF